jgi:hypothetical protein
MPPNPQKTEPRLSPRSRSLWILIPLLAAAFIAALLWPSTSHVSKPAPQPAAPPIEIPLAAIQQSKTPSETAHLLDSLRRRLSLAPRSQSISAILAFLRSKQDAPTHLPFKLNPDGSLASAPTLRTFLMDTLAALDKTAAAQYAREVLASKTSPDEWAVALRAIALADSSAETTTALRAKIQEMALYEPWQENPSAGFLEAFDVLVYTQDTDFVPNLSAFTAQSNNPAVAHAAFLTLDRLVQTTPADTLQKILDQPSLTVARGPTAAAFFARADPTDPSQRQLLETYLLSTQRTPPELQAFANVFPNEIFLVSNNLLTQNPSLPNDQILARYDAASQLITQWQADPRFQSLLPWLNSIQSRIARIRNG